MNQLSTGASAGCRRISRVRVMLSAIVLGAVLFDGAGAPSTAAAVARPVRVPATIDATGSTDVSGRLARFLAAVPDGATIVFPARARYRVEQSLVLQNRHHLTIVGNGATIFATSRAPAHRSQWDVIDSSDITFRNITVVGANKAGGPSEVAYVRKLEDQHGFRLEAVHGVELDHVSVTDVFGDFVYIGRDQQRRSSDHLWVHDSTFARNGRQGISVTSAVGVVIERNRIADTRRAVIDLEPNARSWKVSDVFVLDNAIGPGRLDFIASHGRGPVDDVMISRNVLTGHTMTIDVLPPVKQRRANWVVSSNTSDVPIHHRAMRFAAIDGLLVQANRAPLSGAGAVVLTATCGARTIGNDFGSGTIVRRGPSCTAPLRIPNPAPFRRIAAPPTVITTATTLSPPVVRPRPTTTVRVPNSTGSTSAARGAGDDGNGAIAGLVGVALLLVAGTAVALRRRKRR
jgi:hypothetical protein